MDKINNVFLEFQKHNFDPKGELFYTNSYTLLVAVILSAQSTDKHVNKVTKELFKIINNPVSTVKMGLEELTNHISSIGLYNNKAKNIIAMSKILISDHNGKVPDSLEKLVALPGVGKKTAKVVLNIAFNLPVIAVDTHVFRVSNRIGIVKGETIDSVEKAITQVVPDQYRKKAHNWLVLHGRYICMARKPKCEECHISKLCDYYNSIG